ncbi:terminase [Brevibacterium sp. R8603A2]|uniref:terminase n=1 Tax=Brevibacterium sp. R8603A2 TaxID=2929779 RepID=UPI001FFA0D2D|nr:terminase [Brevibacterium sp. R8603A2]MCK1801478.1 terminase [Brevibacterium sp. R8603A2]
MKCPKGLKGPGRALWVATVERFEVAEHEGALLEEACRVRDRVVQLREAVESDGLMIPSSQGLRLHPAVAEERQQKLVLARLLATLSIPGLDEDELPASTGVRGVYRAQA